jgi:hypothetical protein
MSQFNIFCVCLKIFFSCGWILMVGVKAHLHFSQRLMMSIASSRDDFSRSYSKVDDVGQRQSPATMEL